MGNGPSRPPPPPPPIHLLPKPKTIYYKVDNNNWFSKVDDSSGEGGWFNEFVINTNSQGDPAYGCQKEFTSTYKCASDATKVKEINLSKEADGKAAVYNCVPEFDIAVNNRLQVDDDGSIKLWNAQTGEVLKSWQISGNLDYPTPEFAAKNSKFGTNYMVSGQTLFAFTGFGSKEYIGSPSGNCFVALIAKSGNVLELKIGYPVASSSPDGTAAGLPNIKNGDSLYGKMGNIGQSKVSPDMSLLGPTQAIYTINQFDGKQQAIGMGNTSLYVNYNMDKAIIPEQLRAGMNNQYTSVGTFNQGRKHEIQMLWGANLDSCQDTCNSRPDCWGFVYNKSDSSCSLKNYGMFPTDLLRRFDEQSEMYVRGMNYKTDHSCSKNSSVVFQDVFEQMPDLPNMTPETSCDLREITKEQRAVVAQKEAALMAIAKDVKAKATGLKGKNDILANKIIQQLAKYQAAIGDYTSVKHDMEKNQAAYTQVNAMETTSELELISNNYQFLAFTGMAALGVIAAIKATN